jgi:hypothetical protein
MKRKPTIIAHRCPPKSVLNRVRILTVGNEDEAVASQRVAIAFLQIQHRHDSPLILVVGCFEF